MPKKNPIIERVIQLRTQHFGKRGKSIFARELGISPSTYNYYEQDRVPPADILLKMSKATGVGLGWLIAGEENFADASNNSSNAGPGSDIGRAVEALVTENPQLRQAISAFIEIICEKNNIENTLIGSDSRDESRSLVEGSDKSNNVEGETRSVGGKNECGDLMDGSRSVQSADVGGGDIKNGDGTRSVRESDVKSGSVVRGDMVNGVGVEDVRGELRGDGEGDLKNGSRRLVRRDNRLGEVVNETQDGTHGVGGSGSTKEIAVDGKLRNGLRGVGDGDIGGEVVGGVDADVKNGMRGGNVGGGLRDGVGMIPVLGRTAAGIVHCWDQCGEPKSWQAETKLAELVKKHIGKDIVGSNSGEVEVDSDAAKLAGVLVGKIDRSACIVGVSSSDEGVVEFVDSFDMAKRYPDCFGLRVDGDSMRPMICDGDIVILSPSVPAKQGSVAVAKVRDQIGVTCKIVRFDGGQVHLVAGNENYETRVVERGQLIWALAVLGHVRRR